MCRKNKDLFLYQHVTEVTKYREGSMSLLLYLIFTNEKKCARTFIWFNIGEKSGHLCWSFECVCYKKKSKSTIQYQTVIIDDIKYSTYGSIFKHFLDIKHSKYFFWIFDVVCNKTFPFNGYFSINYINQAI